MIIQNSTIAWTGGSYVTGASTAGVDTGAAYGISAGAYKTAEGTDIKVLNNAFDLNGVTLTANSNYWTMGAYIYTGTNAAYVPTVDGNTFSNVMIGAYFDYENLTVLVNADAPKALYASLAASTNTIAYHASLPADNNHRYEKMHALYEFYFANGAYKNSQPSNFGTATNETAIGDLFTALTTACGGNVDVNIEDDNGDSGDGATFDLRERYSYNGSVVVKEWFNSSGAYANKS